MTIRTAAQAAEVARNTKTNEEGMCQAVTRGYYNAPSAGDRDRDGDADAYDGWLSEPISARRTDRNPPLGAPVSFKGGGKGHGHRAITINSSALIRSTDFDTATKRYKAGVVGNGTIAEIERAMGVTYLGWSTTIDGQQIPELLAPAQPKPTSSTPTLADLDIALDRLAKSTKGPEAVVSYTLARTILKSLGSTTLRNRVPLTTAALIAALDERRADATGFTKARLTATIALLRPLAPS